AILWELVVGRHPFVSAPDIDVDRILRSTRDEPVPTFASLKIAAPRELDQIARRALAKSPRDRYATASEFLKDVVKVQLGFRAEGTPLGWQRYIAARMSTGPVRTLELVVAPPAAAPSLPVASMAGQVSSPVPLAPADAPGPSSLPPDRRRPRRHP